MPVLYFIFVAGAHWAGWTHWLALGQAVLSLILILVLARRYPLLAVGFPVVSFILAFVLWNCR